MDRPTRRGSPFGTTLTTEVRRRRGGPRRNSAEKRQRILSAALRCFVNVGYEHSRIGDICAESGFSVGSVYHFFGSKAEVAADLCADGTRRWAETMRGAILTAPSAEAAVRGYVLSYFRWVRDNADLYNFMNDHRPDPVSSPAFADIEGAHASVDSAVRTRFEAEAADGRMRAMSTHLYRAILDGPCYAHLLWWSRHRSDMDGLPEMVAAAIWQALGPPAAGPAAGARGAVSRTAAEAERAAHDVRLPPGGPPGVAMRRRILAAALAVFNELGYEQATVADVAQKCGASIGTIYYHFASKEEIAAHWCREGWRDWSHSLLSALQAGETAREMVRNLVIAMFRWVQTNTDLYAFLYDARRVSTGPLVLEAYEATRRAFVSVLHETLSAAAARGEVRQLGASAYVALIVGMCQGYLVPWTARRDPLGEVPEAIADAVWRALRPDVAAEGSAPAIGGGTGSVGEPGRRAPFLAAPRQRHRLLSA
ncbi:MAG: TetR/AcrR family transcriptional regulator [Alphaproteobacteria bacterium]